MTSHQDKLKLALEALNELADEAAGNGNSEEWIKTRMEIIIAALTAAQQSTHCVHGHPKWGMCPDCYKAAQQEAALSSIEADSESAAQQSKAIVPDFILKEIRKQIELAKNPIGMSVHSGKVTLDISHVERLLLAASPSAASKDAVQE